MEILIIIFFAVFFALIIWATRKSSDGVQHAGRIDYDYKARSHLMTRVEEQFFRLLTETVAEKYYVFPQIHLSALLDHKIKGQNWKGAFAHINGKSVDYVLCDKNTLKPVYAIELDDYTHKREDRIERDARVERLFMNAAIPLVRFTNIKLISRNDIIIELSNSHQSQAAKRKSK